MKITAIIITILLATSGIAQDKWWATDQVWNVVYVESAIIGTLFLNHVVGMNYWQAYLFTIFISIMKEIGDQIYHVNCGKSGHWLWDYRGGSFIYNFNQPGDVLKVSLTFPLSWTMRKR